MKVSDEMLMALTDGELDADTAESVAQAVSADPALQARLAEFELTRRLAKGAFASVLEEPVPPRLVAALGGSRSADRKPHPSRRWWPFGAAVAAGIAGFAIASLLGEIPQGAGTLPDTRAIAQLLKSTPSGETIAWRGDSGSAAGSFAATGSFAVPDGVCRTFTLEEEPADAGEWRGVACHQGELWSVEILVAGAAPEQSGFFSTASERATQSIDAFLDAMGAGGALEAAEEAALMANNWRIDEAPRE